MIVALAGGVGGSKLAFGLARGVAPDALTIVVNTGDDFTHLGLAISPDLDTVMYTLAGIANVETGWGQAGETWQFMGAIERLGGESWFRLGDKDLATHVERTRRLKGGETLSAITADFCGRLGIATAVVPMTDDEVRTIVGGPRHTHLAFQDYLVKFKAEPKVTHFVYDGAKKARPAAAFAAALEGKDLEAVILCPSNPFVSIDPILAVGAVRAKLARGRAPIIAVSPIVGGEAVKGPLAKMLRELGRRASATTIAEHYGALLDGFVLDRVDAALAPEIEALGPRALVAETVMRTDEDKIRLARETLEFARELKGRSGG